jgi:hypothetical protein
MARTSENLTTREVNTYIEFCAKNRIVCDGSEAGISNGDLIGGYVALTWNEDLTPFTLATALEKLKDRIVFQREKSTAEIRYDGIATENPQAASILAGLYPKNQLVTDDPEIVFEVSYELLVELRGRVITPQTIQDAIIRNSQSPLSRFNTNPDKKNL